MRRLIMGIVTLVLAVGIAAPSASAAGASDWRLSYGPGNARSDLNAFGDRIPYIAISVGSGFDLDGVGRASAPYVLSTPTGSTRGAANIWSGLDDFTGDHVGYFLEIDFPDSNVAGAYALTIDLAVPAHWRCPKYDPKGCAWVTTASAHREYRFTYGGYPDGEEMKTGFTTPIIYSRTTTSTVTSAATATARKSAKVTVRRHGVRVTKKAKARVTVTRKSSARASASGTGYSLADAEAASSKAASSKAGSVASSQATKLAKKAAVKKAHKKAKRLAKKKALRAAARYASR